jgi:DNA modification methylase
VIHGNGISGIMGLDPGSVDLVLSDLPSGETVAKFDTKVNLPLFWESCWRCLKPSGTVVVMASSFRFADEVYNSQPKTFRHDEVWSKSIATGFFNAKRAPLRAHEFILVFCRGQGTYNPQMVETGVPITKNSTPGRTHGENFGTRKNRSGLSRVGATNRFPTSVVSVPCLGVRHPARVHPQQKPDALFRRLVLTYSNPGDLVVDPCAGSGTTERAALDTGRRSMCWDIQERFACPKHPNLLDVGDP